jgi:hypothetical protein
MIFASLLQGLRAGFPLASLASLLIEQPGTDQTGIGLALTGLARMGAGLLVGVLTLFLVVEGYRYMTTDETMRGVHLKRALAALLGGAILVIAAVTLAPQIITTIGTGALPTGKP